MNVETSQDLPLQEIRARVEEFLTAALRSQPESLVRTAAEYAALDGGHRWRALVAIAAGRIFRSDALEIVLPGAAGVELAHSASLVLDDLPSMDDARLRRGKPCVHLKFPAWVADLLPVYLINLAYQVSLNNQLATTQRRIAASLELAQSGFRMIHGQELDLTATGRFKDDRDQHLSFCYQQKTGALFAAAAKAGAILCGADEQAAGILSRCGMKIGVAYQLRDDIADLNSTVQQLGKETGMDRDKFTAAKVLGAGAASRQADDLVASAMKELEPFGREADFFRHLVETVSVIQA